MQVTTKSCMGVKLLFPGTQICGLFCAPNVHEGWPRQHTKKYTTTGTGTPVLYVVISDPDAVFRLHNRSVVSAVDESTSRTAGADS
jgi:hypothetical protein